MTAALVTFLLFYLYLIVIPIGISPFETPKVILAEVIIDILLVIGIFKHSRVHWTLSPPLMFAGILFLLSLDTQLLFQPTGAFFGNVFRLQGQFLFWHLLLFSILSKDVKLDKIPKSLYYLSFICLILATLVLGVNENNRAFGTLGEPNALAATALFLFPFVWFKSESLPKFASLAATLAIILLSGSRAGLIGLIIGLLFIILTKMKISSLKSTIICLMLVSLSSSLPLVDKQGWFENRAEIWQTAFMAGLKSPFIGHGFGNIQKVIHKEAVLLNNNVQYQVVDSAHNFLLDFWVQGGLVGVVSILMLIFLSISSLIRTKRNLELTAFLGITTAMLFNPVSIVNLLAFWWLIGQGSTHSS